MKKNFIDREEELRALEKEYARDEAAFLVLYGRRRAGKTTLLSEFIKEKNALYYLATEESEQQNLRAFRELVADFTDSSLLREATIERWEPLFEALTTSDRTNLSSNRLVIVIDEFQYLGKTNPAFPSILQKIWDSFLKDKNVMLVLCGSLITMMFSQTLSYESPLYGRRTAQIRLKQIDFEHYHEFFPGKSESELIEFYSVTGGIPKYAELFKDGSSVYHAIESNVLDKASFLYDEPYFLLQREVQEIGSYFSLMKTIAAGNHKLGDIASALGAKQSGLTKYLKTLIDLDLLKREVPVTEKNPEKSKKGLYHITDNFVRFWFQFVYPNRSFIESGYQDQVMKKIRGNFIDRQVSFVYEDLCRQKMNGLNFRGLWPFEFSKIGRWWAKDTEIDIVALDTQGKYSLFGECKYWKSKVGINVLSQLEEKAGQFMKTEGSVTPFFVLFSINGFTEELITLAQERDDVTLQS